MKKKSGKKSEKSSFSRFFSSIAKNPEKIAFESRLNKAFTRICIKDN